MYTVRPGPLGEQRIVPRLDGCGTSWITLKSQAYEHPLTDPQFMHL